MVHWSHTTEALPVSAKRIRVIRASEAALIVLANAERWLTIPEIKQRMREITHKEVCHRTVLSGLEKLRTAGLIRTRPGKSLGRLGREASLYRARPAVIRLSEGVY